AHAPPDGGDGRSEGEPYRNHHGHAERHAEHDKQRPARLASEPAQQQPAYERGHCASSRAMSETTRPSESVTTRSAAAAASALCVTITSVAPRRPASSLSSPNKTAAQRLSRLPVGSSASTSAGSWTSARATAARWS